MDEIQDDERFTKYPNDVLEHVMKCKFNGTQSSILLAIVRFTYGFHRTSHEMSVAFIAQATNLNQAQVKRELKKLIDARVVIVIQETDNNKPRNIAINTKLEQWEVGTNPLPLGGANSLPPVGTNPLPKKERSLKKDINKKRYLRLSSQDEFINDYLKIYNKHYQLKFKKEHMKVEQEKLSRVETDLSYNINEYDLNTDLFESIVKKHFENLRNNGNIIVFLEAFRRHYDEWFEW